MLTDVLKAQARDAGEFIASLPTEMQVRFTEEARLMRNFAERKAQRWEGHNNKFFEIYLREAEYHDLILDSYAAVKAVDYVYVTVGEGAA